MIYLASPYNHYDTEVRNERYSMTLKATAYLLKRNYIVFSPIVHNHHLASQFDLPREWEFWKNIDEVFLRKADELIVLLLDGWKESIGVKAEIKIAKERGIPIRFMQYKILEETKFLSEEEILNV